MWYSSMHCVWDSRYGFPGIRLRLNAIQFLHTQRPQYKKKNGYKAGEESSNQWNCKTISYPLDSNRTRTSSEALGLRLLADEYREVA